MTKCDDLGLTVGPAQKIKVLAGSHAKVGCAPTLLLQCYASVFEGKMI